MLNNVNNRTISLSRRKEIEIEENQQMKQKIFKSKSQKKDVQQPNAFGNHNQTIFLSCQQNLKIVGRTAYFGGNFIQKWFIFRCTLTHTTQDKECCRGAGLKHDQSVINFFHLNRLNVGGY